MLQSYQIFYREMGVRRLSELTSPRLNLFKGFPKNSVLHHLTYDEEFFPDSSKSYFQGYFAKIPIDIVYQSEVMVGDPKPIPFIPQSFMQPFMKENRSFRYIPNLIYRPIDERSLAVLNYNGLKFSYRFRKTPLSTLEQWRSYQRTMWDNVNKLTTMNKKNHFVIVDGILDIPGYNLMMNFGEKEGLMLSRVFDTPDKLLILNLFNWLKVDSEGDNSVFKLLSKEALSRVNLIFILKDGRCSVLNLAMIYSWTKGYENVTGLKIPTQYDDQVVRRTLLKYFLVLAAAIPEDAVDVVEEPEISVADDLDDENADFDDNVPLSGLNKRQTSKPIPLEEPKGEMNKVVEEDEPLSEEFITNLNEDMEILEQKSLMELSQKNLLIKGKEIISAVKEAVQIDPAALRAEVYTSSTPNEAIKSKIAVALKNGTLNAATYKKAFNDIEKYNKMLDPYGTPTLVKNRVQVNPEALKFVPESIQLKDSNTIFDKSMTQSTLQAFTSEYVSKHLRDDILKMVGGLQSGGVIVQKHDVTMEHTVMGYAELHRLEVKPINGAASTIYFRLPVVEEDGTFKIAGNKYYMRKQIVDIPIRKISSNEVSLSSYYGKAFVSTENRVSQSETDWILKQINIAAFEGSEWIKDVVPGDTFDSYKKAPYIYSMLSTRFISFKAGDLNLRFKNDENVRMKPPKPGAVWCGFQGEDGTRTIWIGQDNEFFIHDGKDGMLYNLGDIYQILKLDAHKAPVRFSELALFRKNVPVGVVLGYRLGWTKLLSLIKAKPRIVESGKRLALESHEYPIPFADQTYIFSRRDKLTSMILAGYMEYAKQTKAYDVAEFENKNVYLNLLSSKGLGAIYIREIDMLFDYFVDPITEEILLDIKEPTTFAGLLLRSSELLMTYDHSKNYDGINTRIRGYERLAGAVYKELTTSVRQFRTKNIAGRSKVELGPWKVWQNINGDASGMLVPEINPYQELKNDEGVTYAGEGGRSSDGMNKMSRSFHVNDIGTISEATVDNKDVGVNIFTSANPNFKNLRGLRGDEEVTNTSRHSSVVLMAGGAMHDD